jgi:hypothetical protein
MSAGIFSVDESALPYFEVDEHPQTLRMVFAREMARDKCFNKSRVEYGSTASPLAQHVFV